MGRSQRHRVLEQGSNAAGAIHDEGAVAPGIAMQVDATELNVMESGVASPPIVATQTPRAPDLTGVEVPGGPPGGPLQGSSLTGAIPEELQTGGGTEPPDTGPPEPGPDPEPGFAPVLNSINPSSAYMGSAVDVTMNVNGNNFTETSLIYFNGGAEVTTFNNSGQLSTIVKPSLATTPGEYPVWVQQGSVKTAEKMFEFKDPNAEAGAKERTFPIGPFSIRSIDDHADGIAIMLVSPENFLTGNLNFKVGDTVLVEATGNTSVNGSYEVLATDGMTLIVDNTYVLPTPIDAKGRVTVTSGV